MKTIELGEPKYPPIFILSCERSGSTLLRYVLDTHSRICSPGELVLGRLCNDLQFVMERTIGVGILQNEAKRCQLEIIRRELRRIIGGIMDNYAYSRQKDMWCDKSPWNIMYLEDLESVFPEARFICLYRNCLDVVYSCIKVSKLGFMPELAGYVCRSPGNVVAALIDSWIEKNSILQDLERRRPSNCFRVKYESLASEPARTLEPVFSFLGVNWEQDILDRVFRADHDSGGGDLKIRYTSGFRIDSIGRGCEIPFRCIPPDHLERMNVLLRALDYPEVTSDLNENPPRYVTGKSTRLIESIRDFFIHHLPKRIELNALEMKKTTGSLRYIIQGGNSNSWIVRLGGRDPEIIEGDGTAECTIIADQEAFLRLANGESSMIEEILADRLFVEGDIKLAHIAELIS